jgi:hypothetical protein
LYHSQVSYYSIELSHFQVSCFSSIELSHSQVCCLKKVSLLYKRLLVLGSLDN